MDIPILGEAAARARTAQQPADEKPEFIDAECAFIVYQTPDGAWVATADLDIPVTVERPSTRHDIIGGCEVAKHDQIRQMATQETTMNILGNLQRMMTDPQIQMQAMQANEAARAAAAAANGKIGR